MGTLLYQAASEESLAAAWHEVRENDLEDGVKSKAVQEFEKGGLRRLLEMSEQLRAGTYTPEPVMAFEIPKPSGGTRLLGIGTVADRVVERAVLAVIEPYVDPVLLPWSFAYRKGLGVLDAVQALVQAREAGSTWVLRADFADCFETIPRWPVIARLRELVPDAELCLLIQHLVQREVRGPSAHRLRRASGRGLHQGSALSPLLTNLYLDSFDRALLYRGRQVLRYADDFAIPADSRHAAEQALTDATEAAREWGLDLNDTKSQIASFDEGVEFLGRTVGGESGTRLPDRVSPLEATLYVTQPGALVRSRGDRVRVEHNDTTLLSVNLKRVRQVVGLGRVGFSTPFLHRALRQGVELVLLDDLGRFQGRLSAALGGDVRVRATQYEAALDGARALGLARVFVAGKLANLRTGLLRASRQRGARPVDVASAAEHLAAARATALDAPGMNELLGTEGAAAREYFGLLGRLLPGEWEFTHRRRRPPPDPVNAMLSLGYTLLLNDAVVACHIAGLDPEGGFLHTLRRGRASLALDLIEEFRPLIVDAVVTRLALGGKLAPADFDTPEPDTGCRMKPEALKTFLAAYETRMLTLARHPGLGRRVSYRTALVAQARMLAAVIAGEEPTYRPLAWR